MFSRIRYFIAAGLVLVISLGLRIAFIDDRSLWFDEASSWLTSQFPPHRLMDSLKQSTHVPLYYPLLRIWMAIFGDSPTAIRSLSVVLGLLTVGGCGLLGRKLALTLANEDSQPGQHHWFGLFCAALCGFNAFQVLASVEARMYSLGTLLQVLSTLATLHVAESPQKKGRWLLLVGMTVASLYTHHFLALTAGIQAIWLLCVLMQRCRVWASGGRQSPDVVSPVPLDVERRKYPETDVSGSPVLHERRIGLRNWVLAVCVVAVLWIPGLYLWRIQLNRIHKDFWIQPMTFWSVPETCFDFFFSPPPGRRGDFHEAGLIVFAVISMLMLRLLPRVRSIIGLLWLQSVIPLMAIAIVSQHTPLWESRYFRFAHVSLLMCAALSVWSITQRAKLRAVFCVVTLSLSLAGSIASWDWRDIPNRQAVRGAMRLIDQTDQDHPSSMIVISPTDYVIARYYAHQLQWPNDRVRLWTGAAHLPGDAVHLVGRDDWWILHDDPVQNNTVWILGSDESSDLFFDVVPPGVREFEFPSDTYLREWTIHLAKIQKDALDLNK